MIKIPRDASLLVAKGVLEEEKRKENSPVLKRAVSKLEDLRKSGWKIRQQERGNVNDSEKKEVGNVE